MAQLLVDLVDDLDLRFGVYRVSDWGFSLGSALCIRLDVRINDLVSDEHLLDDLGLEISSSERQCKLIVEPCLLALP